MKTQKEILSRAKEYLEELVVICFQNLVSLQDKTTHGSGLIQAPTL